MIERGWLGEKTGQGFYKRVGKERTARSTPSTGRRSNIIRAQKPKFPSVEAAKNIENLPERLRTLVAGTDRAGTFLWKLFSDLFLYSAEMVPEISDRIVEIDRAMRWGYANKLGPVRAVGCPWGFEAVRAHGEGGPAAAAATSAMRHRARSRFIVRPIGTAPRTRVLRSCGRAVQALEERPGIVVLADLKRARGVVKKNAGASLIDLGDGVLCVEFHSKMNALGEDNCRP